MCLYCVTSGNGLVKCHQILSAANAGWKRKDYAVWRQFDEKPSIIPGCPGAGLDKSCGI